MITVDGETITTAVSGSAFVALVVKLLVDRGVSIRLELGNQAFQALRAELADVKRQLAEKTNTAGKVGDA